MSHFGIIPSGNISFLKRHKNVLQNGNCAQCSFILLISSCIFILLFRPSSFLLNCYVCQFYYAYSVFYPFVTANNCHPHSPQTVKHVVSANSGCSFLKFSFSISASFICSSTLFTTLFCCPFLISFILFRDFS